MLISFVASLVSYISIIVVAQLAWLLRKGR
jgi:hypothetical protein